MANTYTANYSLIKPEVGADTNAWGAHLNQNLDTIDTKMKELEDAGSSGGGGSYLPLSGGTLTGYLTLHAAPTSANHAATKAYVDSAITGGVSGAYLPTTGGTLSGNLTVNGTLSTSGLFSVGLAGTWNPTTGAIATIGNISTSTGTIQAFGNIISTAGNVGTAGGGVTAAGAFSGTSLTVGTGSVTCGAINAAAITGTSLNISTGTVTCGSVTASSALSSATLSTTGAVSFNGTSNAVTFNNANWLSSSQGVVLKSTSASSYVNFASGSSLIGAAFSNSSSVGVCNSTLTQYAVLNMSTGVWTSSSDVRHKENIRTIDNALATVKNLRGVFYNLKGQSVETLGVIAQEVSPYLPQAVYTDDNGYHSVAYGNIVGLLINAVKELEARVAELEAR